MAFSEPRRWFYWLALAEWWYNTTYHSSLKTTPYQALYGNPPPIISEVLVPGPENEEARDFLAEKEGMLKQIKENLVQAQARMKKYADQNRSERTIEVGNVVYLKMQPYRLVAFGLRQSLKLTSKFYGPFRVLQKVGKVAYHLQLPIGVGIHPVFYISQLKKHLGPRAVPDPQLPMLDREGRIKMKPVAVLETRALPKHPRLVTQWLSQWINLPPKDATWEDVDFIKGTFSDFYSRTIRSWFPTNEP